MNYSLIVKPKATADMRAAEQWYNKQREGLGDEFTAAVLRVFDAICLQPLAAQVRLDGIRRVAVRRFPYGVFYRVTGNRIRVIAVYHDKRDPSGWMKRR